MFHPPFPTLSSPSGGFTLSAGAGARRHYRRGRMRAGSRCRIARRYGRRKPLWNMQKLGLESFFIGLKLQKLYSRVLNVAL